MLSKIREKATGIFAWIIVIIITIPFALWGINSYFEGGGQAVVAKVEGVDIDLNTFQGALAERRRVMAQVLQQNVNPDFFDSDLFKQQVLEGLIQNAAEASYADRQGYRVGDALVGQWIRSLPYFQVDGQFDTERYQALVANAGMSIARFEQQQRRELISEQIQSAFVDSAFVSERDIDRAVALLEQERIAEYAVLPADDPDLEITVDDEQIREYYESNRDAFVSPAQMRVEYLVLSLDEVAASISVDEDEIRQYYESNSARFGRPAERRASHVLISVAAGAGEAEVEAARQRAEDIADEARTGADFAELAREHSDDAGSAANGGDLGVINRGSMVQPFEEAVFAMDEAGAVSDPVRTRFGFHVIKMTGYRAAEVAPLEQVRGEIEEELKRQRAQSQYLEQAETFATVVYEQPDTLDPAADALDLEIRTSDWFSAGEGEGMAANDRFRTVAFSEEVRIDGLNSEAFEIDGDTTVALRRLESRESRPLSLDETRDEIRAILQREARANAARERGEAIVQSIRQGESSWEQSVDAGELDPLRFEGTRDAGTDTHARQLAREIFSLPAPEAEAAITGGVATPGGDYIVYRLLEVADADPANVDEASREAVRNILRSRQAEAVYGGFQQALRDAADVTVFEEEL